MGPIPMYIQSTSDTLLRVCILMFTNQRLTKEEEEVTAVNDKVNIYF